MTDDNEAQEQDIPTPHPALERLGRLVGTWTLSGRSLDSDRDNISGTTTFKWLHEADGSFFLQQDMVLDYDGQPIKSHELIGFDPGTDAFSSLVFSNMAPDPWPYAWAVKGDELTISIKKGPMDAMFKGRFGADGNSFSGGWRPSPGADPVINAPYDIVATRVR
jgi:hypothetical protein